MNAFYIKQSEIHGLGLFASRAIPWGTKVIEYCGQRIAKKESIRRERFYNSIGFTRLFELDDEHDLDGLIGCNESVFINHSDTPNLGVLRENGHIWLHVLSYDIQKDEELTFDYGFELQSTPTKKRRGKGGSLK